MRSVRFASTGIAIGGIALVAAIAFLLGQLSAQASRASELQRALGYYRWTFTVPEQETDKRFTLRCRAGDREWSTAHLGNLKAGERIVIFVRRDSYTKRLEYTFLLDNRTSRGSVEDPLAKCSSFVDWQQAECRQAASLLDGVEGDDETSKVKCTLAVVLEKDELAAP